MMSRSKLTLNVARGLTYAYIHIPPSAFEKPYVLLLHGFPSLPTDYHQQISYLAALGYGVIAPELLGYGDTSHPAEADDYRLKLVAGDLVEILTHHSISKVIGIGHDWGVTLLTRLEFYHPACISKMVLLTIGCAPVGQPFNLDAVNVVTKEHLGYEGYGYIDFFAHDPCAAQILDSHQDSFRSLMFAADAELWKGHFGCISGLKSWLLGDRMTPSIQTYVDEIRTEHENAFSSEKGGYGGTLNWYKNLVANTNTVDERAELQRQGIEIYQTMKPVLQILSTEDPIALAAIQKQMTEAYAPNVKVVSVNSGHWAMLEAGENVNNSLKLFL